MVQLGIDQLRGQVRGAVITPDDAGYEEARQVYNAMIDRRPAVVVRCANAGDVVAAVDFARENGLDLAVRGGGHSVPGFGTCDGGVVDRPVGHARRRASIPQRRTARAEGGATWGDFNARDARVRPGDDRRDHLDHRGRRAHPRWRHRLPRPRVRPVLRQPGLGRRRDRRRPVRRGQRGRERRPVLGAPRRRRQLRRGDLVRVPAASGQGHLRRADVLRAGRRRRPSCAFYREFIADAPGGVRRLPRLPDRAAAAVHPGGPPRRDVRRRSWRAGPGRSTRASARSSRSTTWRRSWPSIVGPMPYPALNSAFDALVPPGLQHYWKANFVDRADRRGDRGAPRARAEGAGRQLDDAHLPDQRRVPPGRAGRDGVRLP